MLDPTELYRFETDGEPDAAGAAVLVVALGGFVDAGRTQGVLTRHLLGTHLSTVVASFDIDQLLDYRGRRPAMVFDRDRWVSYADPSLLLHRVVDRSGQAFLLLAGEEPDYQWERVTQAVLGLVRRFGVRLTVSVHGIPMAVPHTRPLGLTGHATDPRLVASYESAFGKVQVPGSLSSLLELRLGEAGHDAMGFAVHVPHYLAQAEYAGAALTGLDALTGATGLDLARSDLEQLAESNRAQVARELEDADEVRSVVAALEQQYDAYMQSRERPSLLATDVSMLPSAEEIGAEFEAFLKDVSDEDLPGADGPGDAPA
ncbi:MAG: proteasome assembly chaperone family protein [Dermatophilaceae bacterium]